MIRGYAPRGNIDEVLYSPKGQHIAGIAIGILCLDHTWQPSPPGDVWNASTYDFPVRYKIVEGMTEFDTGNVEDMFSPKILKRMMLVKENYSAGTEKCFLNNFSESFAPSSVNATDLALLFGLAIYPFSCNRFNVSQSKPFHDRGPNSSFQVVVRYIKARTISSTLSLLYSITVLNF